MKRITLIPVFIISIAVGVKAQQFRFGLQAGAAITDVADFNPVTHSNEFRKFGFVFGGMVATHLSEHSTIQMEIDYMQKGSQYPPDTTNNNQYYRLALNYVDLSIFIKQQIHINVNKKPNDRIGLEFGGAFGALSSYSYSVQSVDYTSSITPSRKDIYLFLGIDYNITQNLYLCLRYCNSVTTVFPSGATVGPANAIFYNTWNAGHNMVFQFSLAYLFGSSSSDTDNTPPPAPTNSGN